MPPSRGVRTPHPGTEGGHPDTAWGRLECLPVPPLSGSAPPPPPSAGRPAWPWARPPTEAARGCCALRCRWRAVSVAGTPWPLTSRPEGRPDREAQKPRGPEEGLGVTRVQRAAAAAGPVPTPDPHPANSEERELPQVGGRHRRGGTVPLSCMNLRHVIISVVVIVPSVAQGSNPGCGSNLETLDKKDLIATLAQSGPLGKGDVGGRRSRLNGLVRPPSFALGLGDP